MTRVCAVGWLAEEVIKRSGSFHSVCYIVVSQCSSTNITQAFYRTHVAAYSSNNSSMRPGPNFAHIPISAFSLIQLLDCSVSAVFCVWIACSCTSISYCSLSSWVISFTCISVTVSRAGTVHITRLEVLGFSRLSRLRRL